MISAVEIEALEKETQAVRAESEAALVQSEKAVERAHREHEDVDRQCTKEKEDTMHAIMTAVDALMEHKVAITALLKGAKQAIDEHLTLTNAL